jgi:hypothetical protein
MALVVLALAAGAALAASCMAAEKVLFSFEEDSQGWEVPEWALEKSDYVAKSVEISQDYAREGVSSLRIAADFPGRTWTAVVVEVAESFDLTQYSEISCDIYLPKEAPEGLKGKIILTVGENWKWAEMSRSVPLVPGQWTTISASILPGSTAWQKTVVDDNFRKDIRKIDIRVESNKRPAYTGPIYIDGIKATGR